MIGFISREVFRLAPYTPGEQPQNQEYMKLIQMKVRFHRQRRLSGQ